MNRKVTLSLVVLVAGILACVVPPGMTPTPIIVTQVVVVPNQQEQLTQVVPNVPPPTIPVFTATLPATGTPISTATSTATSTLTGPVVTLIKNANCRKGPGTAYDVVTSYLKGQTLQILNRNPDFNNTWWEVKMPTGGRCWISLLTGQAHGDFDAIPTVTP